MSDVAIKVERLSKRFRIGANQQAYRTLREKLNETALAPFRAVRHLVTRNGNGQGVESREQRAKGKGGQASLGSSPLALSSLRSRASRETFWALKDVSFEVKRGEVVGIIGRNGAGKSTLLKILSRITEPTEGYADINGRIASLLEVGTGFHPELTGRENIFLNGSILGMKRVEINKKFDEIIAFAEIEKFIDTPVKHYSSGMYVRLAFAVAAHLDPEILLVDEVLAVGDAAFQKKCLGKMGDVAREGRTVLFVSHNMVAVSELCEKCIWIDAGEVRFIGHSRDSVGRYLKAAAGANGTVFNDKVRGDGRVKLESYEIKNQAGLSYPLPTTREDLSICVRLYVNEPVSQPAFGISVVNEFGVLMTSINTVEQGLIMRPLPAGEHEVNVKLSSVSYLPGVYFASFWVMNPQGHIYAYADNQLSFELAQTPLYGTRQLDHRWGCVYTRVEFDAKQRSNNSTKV